MNNKKIVLAGGSGFLGRTLTKYFTRRGFDIIILSRKNGVDPCARIVQWDGRTVGAWTRVLEGPEALINLSGRSVDCRYTPKNRKQTIDSRVESTTVLEQALARCAVPPKLWINMSTATIYKHTFDSPHDEFNGKLGATADAEDAFSVSVATAWENAFNDANSPMTRRITLRSSLVLGPERGGAYHVLRNLARSGLGGKVLDGRQWVSWIHSTDFCRAVDSLIHHQEWEGVYNVCSPNPVSNKELMGMLRQSVHMPIGLSTTRSILGIGCFLLRTQPELVIKSRNVIPRRLLEDGFQFQFPELKEAIGALSAYPNSPEDS